MPGDRPPVLILAGPTAVGKSELGLALAEELGGEILAADSMQVYRLMDIGTAKPTPAERAQVPHHLLDLVYPDQPFSAARYAEEFARAAGETARRDRLPIIVGGTGLYIRAAVKPFLFPDAGRRPEIRARLQALADSAGPGELHARLAAVDAEAALRIHPRDTRRLVRALEVYEATGRPISVWQKENATESPYGLLFIALCRERGELYERIDRRADLMLARGFVGEVESLLAAGYSRDLQSMQGLGYRELAAHLAGECRLEEAVRLLKQRTRNYAKRQMTWFRHERDVHWVNMSGRTAEAVRTEILRLGRDKWLPVE